MVDDFANLGKVWVNNNSITNILSLDEVCTVCCITMDSSVAPTMNVHRLDGSVMSFNTHPSRLFVFKANNTTNHPVTPYTMISTVAEQMKLFTRREIKAADDVCTLYRNLGRLEDTFFQKILRNNLLHTCPVTVDNACQANIIYGPDLAERKGKTTHSTAAPRAPFFVVVAIPVPILEHHHDVTLCVDCLFLQGLVFLHILSRNIGYRTSHHVMDCKRSTIIKHLKHNVDLYTAHGLNICKIHGDNEFKCARHTLLPVTMNIVLADCHVKRRSATRSSRPQRRSAIRGSCPQRRNTQRSGDRKREQSGND